MGDGPTIGVLSPFLGGPYFGSILAALERSARRTNGRIVGLQTLDAGAVSADTSDPSDFHHPTAWRYIDGFIVVIDAVSPGYLRAMDAAGKPCVVISHQFTEINCPTVFPDNVGGVREAMTHLIGHGHTRIGFMGYFGAHDIVVRHMAYVETLRDHGIAVDPGLRFDVDDNLETGGRQGAQMLLRDNLPCTALFVGTDANAIGLLNTLTAAGHEIPRDLAIASFDDMEDAAHSVPGLSSVRQPFGSLGSKAFSLLLDKIQGRPVAGGRHYVPTSFITRESCGCVSSPQHLCPPPSVLTRQDVVDQLTLLLDPGDDSRDRAPLTALVDRIVTAVETAAREENPPFPSALHRGVQDLYRNTTMRGNLARISETIHQYAQALCPAGDAATQRVEAVGRQLLVKLAQAQTRSQFDNNTYFQAALSTQYVISMDLLRSHEKDPRNLGWLAGTEALGGCLGLWRRGRPGPPEDPVIDVTATYRRPDLHPRAGADLTDADGSGADAAPEPPVGGGPGPRALPVSAFPPRELLSLADDHPGAVVFVIPVKSHTSDWGILSVVGTVESTVPTGRETISHWSALLTVALDHEAVMQSLRRQEDRLRRAALYDELTGLPNRALFMDRLRHSIRRTRRRPDYHFAELFLDIDGFKVVNDSLGHSAGDRMLIQVAERIKSDLRDVDTAARFGGDEFLVLLEDISDRGTPTDIARRLQASLARPFRLQGQDVVVSASMGIALGSLRYDDPEEVLRDADIAMHTAKAMDRGSHAIFDVEMHARAVSRLQIEAELRQALEHNNLEVHYQPIVDLRTRRASGFEALIRWRHPTKGLIPPGEFLAVAEESGLMLPIGRWVLEESCRQLGHWRESGDRAEHLRMSVNISNRQFWHGDLLTDLDACLDNSGIPAQRLALEITEGVIMHNVDLACKILESLHQRGVELHIDDFGTGYSSLEALHQLPLDALKIDRSFVSRLGSNPRSGELVRTIVLMGGNLGLEVIAEGIEHPSQSDHLRRLGTTYGQGFWFARPSPATVARTMITGTLPTGSP